MPIFASYHNQIVTYPYTSWHKVEWRHGASEFPGREIDLTQRLIVDVENTVRTEGRGLDEIAELPVRYYQALPFLNSEDILAGGEIPGLEPRQRPALADTPDVLRINRICTCEVFLQ